MAITPLTSEQVTSQIQHLVTEKRLSYLDAVMHFCETRCLDPETVAPLLGDKIRSGISSEAQHLHLIPKSPVLPV